MLLVSEDELEGVSSNAVFRPLIWLIILQMTDSKSDFYIIESIDVYSLSAVYLIVRILSPFTSKRSPSERINIR